METYQLKIWNIQLLNNLPKFKNFTVKNDFKTNLLINNRLVNILIDTVAKVSVCGEQEAKLWGIYDKMKPSFAKIHPYNSAPIKVTGTALSSVSFKNRAVPVEFYILPGSCNPILDGNKAEQLKYFPSTRITIIFSTQYWWFQVKKKMVSSLITFVRF